MQIFVFGSGRKAEKKKEKTQLPSFPADLYEPVIRSSICTGEQVACMQEKATGQLHEVMLIRNAEDLERFCAGYGVKAEEIRKVY